MWKYSSALHRFQASIATHQAKSELLDLWEHYYEFLTWLCALCKQDEVSEEDFEWYYTHAHLVLSEFDSSDNPGELFLAKEDISMTVTVVPVMDAVFLPLICYTLGHVTVGYFT